jgi:uncharacterized protein YdcH (DUF465 family)
MDEQLIEMMGKMMEQMNDMQSELKDMNARFEAVEDKLNGVGQHIVEHSMNTVQLREEMQKELRYVTHKIHALDRELFMQTESLQ